MKKLTLKMFSLLLTLAFVKDAYIVVQNFYESAFFESSSVQVVEVNREFAKFPDTFKGYIYKDSNYKSDLYFRICLPAGYNETKQYPVIVFLHGSGECGDDNNHQLSSAWFDALAKNVAACDDTNPCIFVVPQCPSDSEWSNGALKEQNMLKQIKDFVIKGIEKNYSVDTDRLYLTGFSMGGIGTWSLLGKYPDLFAAAVPVSGAGNPLLAFMMKDVPVWAAHSLFDKSVPSIGSIMMVEALKAIKGNIKYTQYNGSDYGHSDAAVAMFSSPELYTWLFAQNK